MISQVSVIDQWGLSSRTLIGLWPTLLLLFYRPVNLSDSELSPLLRLKSTENKVELVRQKELASLIQVAQPWRPDQSHGAERKINSHVQH